MDFFGSNFSNLDIFGFKNLIFSGFESAKIYFFAILKVPKTFLVVHHFGNLVPLGIELILMHLPVGNHVLENLVTHEKKTTPVSPVNKKDA